MKYTKLLLLFAVLFSLLSACNTGKKVDNKELPVITIGVMPSMDYLPLAVAQREKYFEKHGVDVKIQKFVSANERDMAFQSASVDGGVTDYTSAALLKNGGFDMKLTSKCQAPFYIVSSPQSGITSLSQLKGKKIAVSQNTVIDFCVDMALADANLTGKDVNKIEVNKIPIRFEMLRNGKIDATGLPNPFALIAKNEGGNILISMDSLGYTVTGIVFSQKAIDEKADAIRNLYAAYNDGVAYLNSHSVADIEDILVNELNFPEGIAGQVSLPKYNNAQAVAAADKDVVDVIKWLSGKGVISDSFDAGQLVNDQLTK